MLTQEVVECAFPAWYSRFEKTTIRSKILPLPRPVLEYLLEDGQLVLPAECNPENRDGKEDDYEDFGDDDWTEAEEGGSGSSDPKLEQNSFKEFSDTITQTIKQFGGQVFCKLNWSSPKDANWIGFNNSLKVSSLSQLYLLLKSSDFIVHDLTLPFKFCADKDSEQPKVDYCLVLRKWIDVNPGTEFRCFVRNKDLIAVSQRDNTNFYDHIQGQADSIKQDILTFFREHIQPKFSLDNYVFDVIRSKKDKVILVDFNPFGETTEALFFTWEELRELDPCNNRDVDSFEFRYATDSSGVQPHPYRHYSIPRDFVDLSTGSDPAKLMDFLKLEQQAQGNSGDAPEDSDTDED